MNQLASGAPPAASPKTSGWQARPSTKSCSDTPGSWALCRPPRSPSHPSSTARCAEPRPCTETVDACPNGISKSGQSDGMALAEGKETRMENPRIFQASTKFIRKMITAICRCDQYNNDECIIDLSLRLSLTSDWYLSDIWIVTQCEWRGWVP